ncbi:transcriptional regulator [Agromyces sp. CFH 90414]|uniref:Transcriptional regulator n=1 Tax=Agromyces agglutinans TaxID=2662258 RepID=A0A6I2F917_9MICO|nr:helix-turn-helix domain-containing protein [Agromyces agglutinans]MRG60267.1 transcriptional regulator [Agromyces agglutinans]
MATRRYSDACGIARSLDVIGERWALLVVRELVFGPKRFTDLRAGLQGISQNVLSQRLRDLEAAGVVTRTVLGPPASTQAYELTALGHSLEPVLLAMSRWGALTPPEPGAKMSNDAFALALRALFVPAAAGAPADSPAGAFVGRVRLRLTRDAFDVDVRPDRVEVTRAAGGDPSTVLEADESVLRAVMFHRRTLDDAIERGDLRVRGGIAEASAFLGRFAAPTLDDAVATGA